MLVTISSGVLFSIYVFLKSKIIVIKVGKVKPNLFGSQFTEHDFSFDVFLRV